MRHNKPSFVALSDNATISEMTISALSGIAAGSHTFTIRASGQGVESRTTPVNVMVTVPSITVVMAPTSPTVMQGSTLEVPVTITRDGGFTGIVGVSVLGLPAGVTAAFSPASIEAGATTTTLTLSAPLSVQPTAKTVTLRASAQGLADQTIPLQLTVTPTTAPAVLVSVNPAFLMMDGGSSMETQVTLQRFAGFDGAVNVTVDGLPANISASADPVAAGANTTTLRLTAGEQEPGGTYSLSVKANGTGIQQASTGMTVQTRLMPRFVLAFQDDAAPPAEQLKLSIPITIARGTSANILPLRILRTSQYNLPVALTLVDAPAGVTSNLPTTIPSATTSQEFIINISVVPMWCRWFTYSRSAARRQRR